MGWSVEDLYNLLRAPCMRCSGHSGRSRRRVGEVREGRRAEDVVEERAFCDAGVLRDVLCRSTFFLGKLDIVPKDDDVPGLGDAHQSETGRIRWEESSRRDENDSPETEWQCPNRNRDGRARLED